MAFHIQDVHCRRLCYRVRLIVRLRPDSDAEAPVAQAILVCFVIIDGMDIQSKLKSQASYEIHLYVVLATNLGLPRAERSHSSFFLRKLSISSKQDYLIEAEDSLKSSTPIFDRYPHHVLRLTLTHLSIE